MPKNVGRFNQGTIKTQPEAPLRSQGVPVKAPHAGPVPKNQVPNRDNGNSVGRK